MARPHHIKAPFSSVVSSVNTLVAPPGSLTEAHNVEFTEQGAIKPRRGFDFVEGWQPGDVKTGLGDIKQGMDYQGTFFVIDDDGDIVWNTAGGDLGITTETITADYDNGYGWHRYAYMNGNLYYTTDKGIRKIDAIDGSPIAAMLGNTHAPTIINGYTSSFAGTYPTLLNSGAPLWLATANQVRYKVVMGYRDNQENVILGRISNPVLVVNGTGGGRAVRLAIKTSQLHTTSHFIQVYRTKTFSTSTAVDESYYLAFERFLTSSEVSLGRVFINDYVPEALLGAGLYTNPDRETVLQQGEPPPVSSDLASFAGYMFYAQHVDAERLDFAINSVAVASTDVGLRAYNIGSGTTSDTSPTITGFADTSDIEVGMAVAMSPNGLPRGSTVVSKTASTITFSANATASGSVANIIVGDFITITSASGTQVNTYSAVPEAYTPTLSTQFRVNTSGTATQNVTATAANLMSAIAAFETGSFGTSVSSLSAFPGSLFLSSWQVRTNSNIFSVASNRPEAFFPPLTTLTSRQETKENALRYSRHQIPESVPLSNIEFIGASNFPILRVIALQNSLLIFKQDGIYQLTGYSETSFRVRVLDPAVQLTHINSVAVVHNRAYALTDRGVISVGENDVRFESQAIHNLLFTQTGGFVPPASQHLVNAISIEDTSEYILQLADADKTAWCLNVVTGQWCNWSLSSKDYLNISWSNKSGDIFLCDYASQYVSQRATTNTRDEFYTIVPAGYSVNVGAQTLTIPKSGMASQPAVGDLFQFGNGIVVHYGGYVASSVSSGANWVVTLQDTWTTSQIDEDALDELWIHVAINSLIAWAPAVGSDIAQVKHWDKATLHFKSNTVDKHHLYWSTDRDGTTDFKGETNDYLNTTLPDYSTQIVRTPLGVDAVDVYSAGVPIGARYTTRLRTAFHHRRAGQTYTLEALDLEYKGNISRNNRKML